MNYIYNIFLYIFKDDIRHINKNGKTTVYVVVKDKNSEFSKNI